MFDAIERGSGTLVHGHTFQAHPTACAAAIEVQRIIARDNLLENVREMGSLLDAELKTQLAESPFVADVRGRGLFYAVEFMLNPASRRPFDRDANYSNRVVEAARSLGLNILGNLGDTGEYHVEHVILSPPYIVNAEEIKEIVRRLKAAIEIVDREYLTLRPETNGGEDTAQERISAVL